MSLPPEGTRRERRGEAPPPERPAPQRPPSERPPSERPPSEHPPEPVAAPPPRPPGDAPGSRRGAAQGLGRIEEDLAALPPAPKEGGGGSWLLGLLGLAVTGVLLFDLYGWVEAWFASGPVQGAVAASLALGVAVTLLLLALREWRSLRRLAAREGEAPSDPRAVAELLADAPDAARSVALWRELSRGVNDPERERALFEEVVLGPRDVAAEEAIARARGTVAGSVFVVPAGLLESLVFAALGLGLIRRIATIYGLRPGLLATLRLARRVLAEAAAIGALDVAAQGAARAFGALPAAADAALAALAQDRMRRIGRAAIRLCRPWPPHHD